MMLLFTIIILLTLGRITLEKCKKYKIKKERADELAELDVDQIIDCSGMQGSFFYHITFTSTERKSVKTKDFLFLI